MKWHSLEEQIQSIKEIMEDAQYNIDKSRSPKRKRQAETTYSFFSAIKESLCKLHIMIHPAPTPPADRDTSNMDCGG